MPYLDSLRRRISVSDAHLDSLRMYFNARGGDGSEAPDSEHVEQLRAAGLITAEGEVHHLVLDLVRVMTQPMIELIIESESPEGATVATITIHDEDVWYSDPWPDGGEAPNHERVWCRDELPQLLWIVARLVGVRRGPVPELAKPFSAPLGAVGSALAMMALGEDPWDDVRQVVIAKFEEFFAGVQEEHRPMLLATLATLQATWRITCVWGPIDATHGHVRGIAVWDCGPGGYWVRTVPAEPLTADDISPDAVAEFEPQHAGQLWQAFAGLLPSKAELEAVAALSEVVD